MRYKDTQYACVRADAGVASADALNDQEFVQECQLLISKYAFAAVQDTVRQSLALSLSTA
jgi:hypothetical protein